MSEGGLPWVETRCDNIGIFELIYTLSEWAFSGSSESLSCKSKSEGVVTSKIPTGADLRSISESVSESFCALASLTSGKRGGGGGGISLGRGWLRGAWGGRVGRL